MAELGMADEIEVVVPAKARAYAWRPPRWMLPAAVTLGITLWTAGIGWMAANIGGSDAPAEATQAAQAAADRVAVLQAKVDSLAKQTTALTQERESLTKRVAALEARPTVTPVPAGPAIVPMPGVGAASTVTATGLAATDGAFSIPRFTYPRSGDPSTVAATVYAGAIPARDAAGMPATSRFLTNGMDKYNCTSFGSQAEAQEALAANAPGDPNRLDMNGNGVACEDITYAANTAKNLTPIANR